MVQLNVLGTDAPKAILGDVALHVVAVLSVVTTGVGFTVTVCVAVAGPLHPAAVAVITEVPDQVAT
jgi:hypothetical protein